MIDERYLHEVNKADGDAERILVELRSGNCDSESFKRLVKQYLLVRFMLAPDVEEKNLYNLSVMSIKASLWDKSTAGMDYASLRIEKHDCRQANSAVRKKALLIMNLESKLGIRLSDDQVETVETIEDLASLMYPEYVKSKESRTEVPFD